MNRSITTIVAILLVGAGCLLAASFATLLLAAPIIWLANAINGISAVYSNGFFEALYSDSFLTASYRYILDIIKSEYSWIFYSFLALAVLACTILALHFYTNNNTRRDVKRKGVLGNERLVNSFSKRRKGNIRWNGKGTAPKPSLVYGFERGQMMGDPDFAHGIVVAKSGASKSRSIGYASLFWNVRAGASIIYTARKLTEYKLTYQAIESTGVSTYLLDLEKPKRGSRINLMDTVNTFIASGDIAGAQRAARQLASDFIKHEAKNPFFSNSARALFTSAILIVAASSAAPDEKNIISTARIVREGLSGEGADPASSLKDYIRTLGTDHPAYKAAADFLQDSGTTAGQNVRSTLLSALSILGDGGIEWMLSGSDFTLEELLEKQNVLYLHCLGENDPYNVVLSALYNQLWTTVQTVASKHGERLPGELVILGDEWGNLPRVDSLGEMVSLGRSLGLRVFCFIQNLAQLNKYNNTGDNGAGVDKLLGSMNLQIVMSVIKTEPDGKYFSALSGKKTVLVRSDNQSHNNNAPLTQGTRGHSFSEQQVDLLPAYSFKNRVPLRDGIIVIKGGENAAQGREGIFNMPIVDATKIKPVKSFFDLGTKEYERARLESVERLLTVRAMQADSTIPTWCPNFKETESSKTRKVDIADDEFGAWD